MALLFASRFLFALFSHRKVAFSPACFFSPDLKVRAILANAAPATSLWGKLNSERRATDEWERREQTWSLLSMIFLGGPQNSAFSDGCIIMVLPVMLAHIAGIIACLAGLSLALAYAVSDIRRRPGTRDEVKPNMRTRHAMHYASPDTTFFGPIHMRRSLKLSLIYRGVEFLA